MTTMLKLLSMLALAANLSGCGPTKQERAEVVGKAMEAALHVDFKKLRFEEVPLTATPAPTLVFEGSKSVMLSVSKPALKGKVFPKMQMRVLARSEGGRFFEVTYESDLSSPTFKWDDTCVESECRRISQARMLSVDDAKGFFFRAEDFTEDRYKAIFGEAPPPKHIPA